MAVGITVGIGIIELTGAATQNFASVAGTATTGLHAGIHGRTNKDVRQVLAALRANGRDRSANARETSHTFLATDFRRSLARIYIG